MRAVLTQHRKPRPRFGALAIRRGRDEVHHARALRGAERTGAHVFAFKARLPRAKRSHDVLRDVVAAVFATWISARQKEERGSMRHDHASHVHRLDDRLRAASLFDLELQGREARDLRRQSRRFVFAAASFCESLRRVAHSSVVQRRPSNRMIPRKNRM